MLDQCWATVPDAGPALIQHWENGSCLLGTMAKCQNESHWTVQSEATLLYQTEAMIQTEAEVGWGVDCRRLSSAEDELSRVYPFTC